MMSGIASGVDDLRGFGERISWRVFLVLMLVRKTGTMGEEEMRGRGFCTLSVLYFVLSALYAEHFVFQRNKCHIFLYATTRVTTAAS